MTWFRSDDDLPEHPKSDVLEQVCPAWADLAAAWMTWHHLGCDCARRRTDGTFTRSRAHRAVRLPPAVVDAALEHLTRAGFLEVTGPDAYAFHGWDEYQPTKAELDSEKRGAAERQKAWRMRQRAARNGVTNAVTDGVTNAVSNGGVTPVVTPSVTAPRPVPSRYVSEEEIRGRETLRAPDPEPPALKLTANEPVAPKAPKRPRKAPDADPPPFSHLEALAALAGASGGRVAHVEPRDLDGGTTIALRKMVRSYPSLEEWRVCGEWIAAGGDRARQKFGASWAASAGLRDAMAASRAWADGGRPALLDARGFPVVTAAAAEPADDPWVRAMRKAEERGLA